MSSSESDPELLSPNVLLCRGNELLKNKEWEDAVAEIQSALEQQLKKCEDNEMDDSLAEYYDGYGQALLKKFQNRENALLVGETDKEEAEEAWNVLELARILYEKRGSFLELSRIHVCIGDLMIEMDDIGGALKEYTEAERIRRSLLDDITDQDNIEVFASRVLDVCEVEILRAMSLKWAVDDLEEPKQCYRIALSLLDSAIERRIEYDQNKPEVDDKGKGKAIPGEGDDNTSRGSVKNLREVRADVEQLLHDTEEMQSDLEKAKNEQAVSLPVVQKREREPESSDQSARKKKRVVPQMVSSSEPSSDTKKET